MFHNTDYQRYKHKLDRLQSKIKKSESARKELETKFQILLKERNECERSAQDHKSKYDLMLKHETERLNRNEELLHILENAHVKAARMASNTERLKKLKMQQQFIVMNNLRRNAHLQQQHFMQPKAILTNSILNIPGASSYEHESASVIYPIQERFRSYPLVYGTSGYFTDLQRPVFQKTNEDKPTIATVAPPQFATKEIQTPVILEPIYIDDPHYIQEVRHLQDNTPTYRYLNAQRFIQQPQFEHAHTILESRQPVYVKQLSRNDHLSNEPVEFFANQSKIDFIHPEASQERPDYGKYFTYLPPNRDINLNQAPKASDEPSIKRESDLQSQHNRNLPTQFKDNQSSHENQYRFTNQPLSFDTQNNSSGKIDMRSLSKDDRLPNLTSYKPNPERQFNEASHLNTNDNSPRMTSILSESNVDVHKYDTNIEPPMERTTNNVSFNENYRERFSSRVEPVELIKSPNDPASKIQNIAEFSPEKYKQTDLQTTQMANESVSNENNNNDDHQPSNYYGENKINTIESPEQKQAIDINEQPEYSLNRTDKRRSSIDTVENRSDRDDDLYKMSAMAHRRYSAAVNSFNLQRDIDAINSKRISSSFASHDAENLRENIKSIPNDYQDPNGKSLNQIPSNLKETEMKTLVPNTTDEMQPNPQIIDDSYYDNEMHVSTKSASIPTFPEDAINENYHENINDVQQNENVNAIYTEPIDASYATYGMNDQTVLENAIENLHLEQDAPEQDATDETQQQKVDRSMHGKTVTWADDIDNNFKKLDSTQHHEKQDTEILHDTDSFSNNKDGQQYQNEYLAPEYSDVNNGIEVEPNVSNIQYDDNQYQAQSIDPNNQIAYNNEYYYPDQELNQYEQQYDPQQIQADTQHMQYYANDVTEENANLTSYPNEGYPQYEMPLQETQSQNDAYYSVTPGENYYNEYEGIEQNANYSMNTNESSHNMIPENPTILEQHQVQPGIENATNMEQTMTTHIPNYLQSDTDDSQTGYHMIPDNQIPQNQDSDFDFSTNSENN